MATARLTDSIAADHALGVTVPRDQVAAVLEADGHPELVLDLIAEGTDATPTSIGIEWSREDLETLFGQTDGDAITLTFDRDELNGLFDDVEAHGLRTRAAIIAVAAVGALGSAAGAYAMPTMADNPGAPVGAGGSATPAMVSDAASGGGYATPAVTDTGGSMVTDASTGGGYGVPAAAAASSADTMMTDASTGGGYGPAPTSGGGETWGIPTPTPTDGLLLGAAVVAIAGATFAARRPGAARPA